MDQVSRDRLDEILRKEPAALSQGDIDFLRARKSYLTASDEERYTEVLSTPITSEVSTEEAATTDETVKPAKKK